MEDKFADRIPFCPFPYGKARRMARGFLGYGEILVHLNPNIKIEMVQANLRFNPIEYMAIAIFTTIYYFFFILGSFIFINIMMDAPVAPEIGFNIALSILFSLVIFSLIKIHPGVKVQQRVRSVEKDLLFAMRHLLIEVKAGIPLFDAMKGVARGEYGMVSSEFKRTVNDVEGGKPQLEALEELALRIVSLDFRRAIWQLISSIKSGADIGDTLTSTVNIFAEAQKIRIRRYGQELNPFAMMYMMFAVVIPSLGITFIIILSSFGAVSFPIYLMLPGLLALTVFFQIFFMNFIKSRRPEVSA